MDVFKSTSLGNHDDKMLIYFTVSLSLFTCNISDSYCANRQMNSICYILFSSHCCLGCRVFWQVICATTEMVPLASTYLLVLKGKQNTLFYCREQHSSLSMQAILITLNLLLVPVLAQTLFHSCILYILMMLLLQIYYYFADSKIYSCFKHATVKSRNGPRWRKESSAGINANAIQVGIGIIQLWGIVQDEKKWTVRKYRKITYELQMEHALAQTPHRNWVIQDYEFDKLCIIKYYNK